MNCILTLIMLTTISFPLFGNTAESASPLSKSNNSLCPMYQLFARDYDALYQSKNYHQEVQFLHQLLRDAKVKTILDIGCGTGNHMKKLETLGYRCTGIDLNEEMLAIARKKVKGPVEQADMCSFDLGQCFDAVICMFAVFNHNLIEKNIVSSLERMKVHLKLGGLVIVDLFNPQGNGRKVDVANGVKRIMEWKWNKDDPFVKSSVTFSKGDYEEAHDLIFRFFPLSKLQPLFEEAGFSNVRILSNYSQEAATPTSHNIIVIARHCPS